MIATIKTVTSTTRGETTYYQVTLMDGKSGSSFNPKFMDLIGKEANVNIVDNGQYPNIYLIPSAEELKPGIRKVKSVKEQSPAGKDPYFIVTFEDGISASFYDAVFRDSAGKEFDVELTSKGNFVTGKIAKQGGGKFGKTFTPKNPREVALGLAVEFCAPRLELTTDQVLQCAEKFMKWIQQTS